MGNHAAASTAELILTLDTDWAPDFVIEEVAAQVRGTGVRATWFATHGSKVIDELSRLEGFEVGIHPNFLPGSSHGGTAEEVLRHCKALFPAAESMRTHGLVQSTRILAAASRAGIRTDVSLFLPHRAARPIEFHVEGGILLRVPYAWEDDFEMISPRPAWRLDEFLRSTGPGLVVFNFHPIHVYLNSSTMAPYRSLCKAVPRLNDAPRPLVERYVRAAAGPGTRSLFDEVLEHLKVTGRSRRGCPLVRGI